jgi:hypothetical protein
MPKIPLGLRKRPRHDIHSSDFNILFFGNFVDLDYPAFVAEMEGILNDPSQVYEAQLREIYTLGTFLAKKKFRFVRLAYLSFITGLLVSGLVMLFIVLLT